MAVQESEGHRQYVWQVMETQMGTPGCNLAQPGSRSWLPMYSAVDKTPVKLEMDSHVSPSWWRRGAQDQWQ
ncbi:uncharacterized protein ColSpa_12174 [Colletotrichum spaethianum]|uniref:Uncharacterized protein n=1 Tax=Colletotrichum spaethianum TaxID=700344 RepID=A0AA37UTI4_9PEZI|nr:uncharacterized protein ColSpa_12174 [Colletotrichum spaethianum]GKT51993.1 hypothetical protein ColSpa_12174 [Colletotrichum spaethianum]